MDALLPHKAALEKHLKEKLSSLFELHYDLLLSDVTSTYFEGEAAGNGLALRGYSRDHRPECKQVNIALVVSRCGMPLGYRIFAGNRHNALSGLSLVDVVLPTRGGTIIKKRCISQPTQHQLTLLPRLGLRPPASLELAAV